MKKIILFIASMSIVLIVIAVLFILNSPVRELSKEERENALTQIVGRKLNLNGKEVITGDVVHKGKYASFLYPAAAKVYHQMVNGGEAENKGTLEYFAFDLDSPRVYVVTEVISASSTMTDLSNYPSVRLRQVQSDQYNQTLVKTQDKISGFVFDKTADTGFEKTAFFYVNGKIYSFSITSVDNKKQEEVFSKIISTLKFYD